MNKAQMVITLLDESKKYKFDKTHPDYRKDNPFKYKDDHQTRGSLDTDWADYGKDKEESPIQKKRDDWLSDKKSQSNLKKDRKRTFGVQGGRKQHRKADRGR